MKEKFAVGEMVMLKSGGPKMTVSSIRGGKAWCIWFINSASAQVMSAKFPADCLVIIR